MISESYPRIITDGKIDPVDYPNVEIIQKEIGKPFIYKINVAVYPLVKLGKYKGLKAEKISSEVTEQDVLTVLGNLQARFAVSNAEGKKDLLPLDDEFAKRVSRFGSLAELKEEVRTAIQNEKSVEAESDLKNKLIAAAVSDTKVDIPPAMIEREIDVMLDELKTSLSQSGLTLEDYLKGTKKEEKALREEMHKSAEIRVRGKVVLKAVAEAEKIDATDEDLRVELKEMAESTGQKPEELEQNMGEDGKRYVRDYLLRRKALDLLIDNATIKPAPAVKQEAKGEEKE